MAHASGGNLALDIVDERVPARRAVLALAWPVTVEMLLQMSVGIADVLLVGRLGQVALTVAGLSDQVFMLVSALFAAAGVGATAVVARHIGAGEDRTANTSARQGMIVSSALALVVSALVYIGAREFFWGLTALMSVQDPVVIGEGVRFLRTLSLTMPLAMISMVGNAVLRGAGDTRTPMQVMLVVNVVNIIGNYVLIFGRLGFPEMGLMGSATATTFARGLGGVLVLWALTSGRFVLRLSLAEGLHLDWPTLARIWRIAYPAAAEQLVMRGGQTMYSVLVVGMGTAAYAAHRVALTAESISFMPGFAFSVAATTLIGQNLGAGLPRRAEESGWEATRIAATFMTVLALPLFAFSHQFVALFIQEPEVIALGAQVLKIVAIAQPSLAVAMVLAGALRGAGDTKWVMYITIIGIWGFRLVLTYLFGMTLGLGLVGAWWAMVIDIVVRSLLVAWRFRGGRWKNILV